MKTARYIVITIFLLTATISVSHAAPDAARIAGDLKVDGIHFTADNSVIRKLADLSSPWTVLTPNIYYLVPGGKVGIGMLSPTVELDVLGTVKASQFSGDGSGLSNVWSMTGNTGTIPGTNYIGTNDRQTLEIRALGGVGINMPTPRAGLALDVNGAIAFSSAQFGDGSIQAVAKTDCMGRYEDNGDGTVSDCRTGLIWMKNAICSDSAGGFVPAFGRLNFANGNQWAAGLQNGFCGLSDGSFAGDWRLPTITEWRAMLASAKKQGFTNPVLVNKAGNARWSPGDLFTNVQANGYWSSSPNAGDPGSAYFVSLFDGIMALKSRTDIYYLWPVRSGQ